MSELGEHAYLFSLEVSDLDPSISDHPSGLYDHATVAALAAAAARVFSGPCWLVLEVGHGDVYAPGGGRLHPHLIAHRNDGPQNITRDSQRCKWVYDGPGAWRYLNKSDPFTLEALIDYTAAKVLSPIGKTPRTRRMFRSAARLAWLESTDLRERLSADPLPPVLPCGRCRFRHLTRCPHCTTPNVLQPPPPRDDSIPKRTRADRYPTLTRGDTKAPRTARTRPPRAWRQTAAAPTPPDTQTAAPRGDKRTAAPAPERPVYATRERPCTPRSAAPTPWQPNVRPRPVKTT